MSDRCGRHFGVYFDGRDLARAAQAAVPLEPARMLRSLMKSSVYLARYLRQGMPWVEDLSLEEMHRWIDVLSEVLKEERGGGADAERADPFQLLSGDD